jgi:hypothetical protein
MHQPTHVKIKAPCGNTFHVHPKDAEARREQLEKDHAEGRGCPMCMPAHTPKPPEG